MSHSFPSCPLCRPTGETVLWQTPRWRVIAVGNEPGVPAFCRVIWQAHVAEMTDLTPAERQALMEAVFRVEAGMRQILRPSKINLASLGNMVPHLHWHVIARFEDDAHFPAPIWAAPKHKRTPALPEDWQQQLAAYLAGNGPNG
ncbi:MAG: HIT domain-containing protein [Eikenella sp.]|nr:HIT domain-containing protein [Eikenella sp.]